MGNFWRKIGRVFISTAATGAAATTATGDPITSGTVLLPSLVAGAFSALYAVLPPKPPDGPEEPPVSFKTPPR